MEITVPASKLPNASAINATTRHCGTRRSWAVVSPDTLTVGSDKIPLGLLDPVEGPLGSFAGDGAYGQEVVTSCVTVRHPEAAIIVPPRANAVPRDTAEPAPTQRDRHLRHLTEPGRMAWQVFGPGMR